VNSHITGLLFHPGAQWEKVRLRNDSIAISLARYALPLSVLPAAFSTLGILVSTHATSVGPRTDPPQLALVAVIIFIGSVSGSVFLAVMFRMLSALFGQHPRMQRCFQVAIHGCVPLWIASLCMVWPTMAIVLIVGFLHSLYLFHLGAHVVLGLSSEDSSEFVALSVTGAGLMLFMLGAVIGRYAVLS